MVALIELTPAQAGLGDRTTDVCQAAREISSPEQAASVFANMTKRSAATITFGGNAPDAAACAIVGFWVSGGDVAAVALGQASNDPW